MGCRLALARIVALQCLLLLQFSRGGNVMSDATSASSQWQPLTCIVKKVQRGKCTE